MVLMSLYFYLLDYYNRDLDLHRLNHGHVFFNHQEVSLMDGFERLKGYKDIVGIDIDEYIVPNRNETWMSLFVSYIYYILHSLRRFIEIYGVKHFILQ